MNLYTVTFIVAATFSISVQAQSPSAPADSAKPSRDAQRQAAKEKTTYDKGDCQKDMANVDKARQAGHATDKEVAEQRKMAQSKIKRDAGQAKGAASNAAC